MPRRGGDDGGDGGGGHGERWEMALTAVREEEAKGGRGRGRGGGSERMCSAWSSWQPAGWPCCLPCSAKASDNGAPSVCKRFFGTPSRFIKNMPSHAAFARGQRGCTPPPRFAHRHACCYTLRHAFASHPPRPQPTVWTVQLSSAPGARDREDQRAKQQYRKERV